MIKIYKNLREKRRIRLKALIKKTAKKPRLSVFRSNKYIYAQLIDDTKEITNSSSSSQLKEKLAKLINQNEPKNKIEEAKLVGRALAAEAIRKGTGTVVFDRGGYRYHGRVKALAEGAREGGLKF